MMPALLMRTSIFEMSGSFSTSFAALRTVDRELRSSWRALVVMFGEFEWVICAASSRVEVLRPVTMSSLGDCREIAQAVSKPRPSFVQPVMRTVIMSV